MPFLRTRIVVIFATLPVVDHSNTRPRTHARAQPHGAVGAGAAAGVEGAAEGGDDMLPQNAMIEGVGVTGG